MADDVERMEDQFVDKRDLEYANKEKDEKERAAMLCAISSYRRPDRLRAGDPAPALELPFLDGNETRRLLPERNRPLVLFFGSYT